MRRPLLFKSNLFNVGGFNNGKTATGKLPRKLVLFFVMTVLPVAYALAQAPTISYSSPQTYRAGTAITPLTPKVGGSGVAAQAYNPAPATLGSGFSNPYGVAADAAGNVYVADFSNNAVKKIPAGGGAPVILGSGFSSPHGVAVDAAGNIYVADYGNSAVKEIPAGGGAPVTLGSGFSQPAGVAVDAAGNVYVADTYNNAVKEIPAGGGAPVILGSGFSYPEGVAVDAAGNVYVADYNNNAVKKIPAGGGTPVTLGSGFSRPTGVAVDAAGNVYVADYNNNAVKEIPAGGGAPLTLGSGFSYPAGVAVDAAGHVYVADRSNNAVKMIPPAGGYYTGPFLPAGLIINSNTGVISGTPTAASMATNYTVTAYNSAGAAASATVNITVTAPPAISYSSPKTYTAGTAITPLTPVGSGVAAQAYNNTPVTLGSGFSGPHGVAVDAAGNVYVADSYNNAVKEIPAGGGAPVTLGSGFSSPRGVAVDAAGNVYVADKGNNAVKEIPAGGGAPVTLGSGFSYPAGVAVDAAGNVYVADTYQSAITEIPAGGGAPVTLGSGFSGPSGVAVDAAGNVYVADTYSNAVKEIPAGGGAPVTLGSGFSSPYGVAVDAAGNVYVADFSNNAVKEIRADGGSPLTRGSGFYYPAGVAVDAAGNVYVADEGNYAVKKILPAGGYYTGPFLPAGLIINSNTGVISGTPTAASAAANYTVTAYNSAGSASATVNIKIVSNNANLASMVLGGGAILSPAFTTLNTSYTASVKNGITSVVVKPTASEPNATIMVNGNAVTSGTASPPVSLAIGPNTITTTVTASDGIATKTYTAIVTREKSPNANLANLKISTGTLSPAFNYLTTDYTASVPNATASIKVTPVTADANATVKINGTAVTSGTASAAIALNFGPNTITTVVTAQNGSTRTYTITVTRPAFTNANLAGLKLSAGTLSPVFATGTNSYTAIVAGTVTSVTVTPTTSDATATVQVNGIVVASGTASAAIPLNLGTNTITTVVTAQDGTTMHTYTVTIGRGASNTNLANLKINTGAIPLTPAFNYTVTGYTASVPNATTSVKITPAASDANAVIKVNGTTVSSGTASAGQPLVVGPNTITTVVTAQDGTSTKTYTVTVTRAPSNNANLANLKINSGNIALTPVFNYNTTSYTASVANAVTLVKVTPATADANATVKINGTAVASGTQSASLPLTAGANTITTVVTAQDGTTTKTYTITVTRAPAGPVAQPLEALSVQKPVESDVINVHQGISPNADGQNDFLVIDGISKYPDNKLSIMSRNGTLIYEASGYDNNKKAFDGHSNKTGAKQLPGTYFYSLDYTVKGIAKHKTGFIVLKY